MSPENRHLPKGEYHRGDGDDLRSPCPVINSLANHGYIARNGRNVTANELKVALEQIGLGFDTATALVKISFQAHVDPPADKPRDTSNFGMRDTDQVNDDGDAVINLNQLGRPHAIEHDVSITRQDRALGDCINLNTDLYQQFLQSSEDGVSFTIADLGKHRKKRFEEQKRDNPTIDLDKRMHYIACAEVGAIACVFGKGPLYHVPKEYIEAIFGEERLPFKEGWKPRWIKVFLPEAGAMVLGISYYAWPF
ncbi:Chloroperoxidase [Aspergillus coremiiformis]|uniref:Chloroperoxidase n=1 Tax=Aspergillus coremiiformis TaxID=138285 RepID=A0A5N6YW51_9EURO|nr:Chloroperoxidase [Aspergillus coremiiformis]